MDYAEIGKRISNIRKSKGMTQFQVCEKCDISDKYLSNIERAKSIPSIEILMRICKVLDTTPDIILLGTNKNNNTDLMQETASLLNVLDDKKLKFINKFIIMLNEDDI